MATGSNVVIAAEALRRIGRSDIAIVAAVAEPVAAEAVTMELGARVVSLDAVA
jgi:uracil phosphoribosyltransferase